MRRRVQVLGWTLIWSSVLTFGYLGFQLFGTDLINDGVQAEAVERLETTLESLEPVTAERIDTSDYLAEVEVVPPDTPEIVPYYPEGSPEPGAEFAFMRIPKIEVSQVVFEGVDRETLKNGPGHMPGTPLPGQPGNAVISGHRTTYGAPFIDLDLLEAGDRIEVETQIGTHVYEVQELLVVKPTDVWVAGDRPGAWLTLTTCTPKFSARERLIVWAEMVEGPNLDFVAIHQTRFGT